MTYDNYKKRRARLERARMKAFNEFKVNRVAILRTVIFQLDLKYLRHGTY